MGKSRRRTEKWFNRLLWLIAILFASFLIGLGGKIIQDLPLMSEPLVMRDFYPEPAYSDTDKALNELIQEQKIMHQESTILSEQIALERLNYQNRKDVFENWLKTRTATLDPERDSELITRTEQLELLKNSVSAVEANYSELQISLQQYNHKISEARSQIYKLEEEAAAAYYKAYEKSQLYEFLIRLAITLPLLLFATWLFVKRRKGKYWPFSWGFIFFAMFAFFFELVPYLPSYGGYVRFGVGIIVTGAGGYYAIRGFNRYRERQKAEESVSDNERRKMLNYSFVLQRIDKSLCPSCERGINYRNPAIDYCPHCGINLFQRCSHCHVRKNAFLNFCASCGKKDANSVVDE